MTILLATGVMMTGFLICELFPHTVASVFTRDKDLNEYCCTGFANCYGIFPYCWISDGHFKFLPEYRNGRQSYFYVINPAGAFSVAWTADPALIFWCKGCVVQYAGSRFIFKYYCSIFAYNTIS